jgi:hypothetical protein
MTRFRLTLTAPTEYGVETFDNEHKIWEETEPLKTEAYRYISDSIRDSVMRIKGITWTLDDGYTLGDDLFLDDSPLGCGEGVYKDFSVISGVNYAFACLYRIEIGNLKLAFYDETHGVLISSTILTGQSWKSYETSMVIPSGCNTLRVKFLQDDVAHSGPFYIDNVSLSGNVILSDPDSYRRIPKRIGAFHQTLNGKRIYDLRAIHYDFEMLWNYFGAEQYEKFREVFYTNELLYFDDGNVPPLIENETIYDNDIYNFSGMTSPSSIHKAYTSSSSNLPSAKDDFETTEYLTNEYQAVSVDDNNYKETSNPVSGCYLYHKFLIRSSINQSDVQRFRVKVIALGEDNSPINLDGYILYAWDGKNWVELLRCSNSAKNVQNYSTAEPIIARQFVDPTDNYVRLLLRSMNCSDGTNLLNLKTYYIEVEMNEDLDGIISLSHKAILDENGDVISVRNLSKGTKLALSTDYTIAIDRRSLTVFGQDSGDVIEVKYNRYFEVSFSSIPEEWLPGDMGNDRTRKVGIVLHTLSQSR